MASLPLNLCPPPSIASCAAWRPTPRSPLPSTASKGLSSIPSHLVGTQTPLPPWLGPLLAPTMAWNRCQRAGSKAVRAMRRLTSWPRACTGSSRRVCEGHSCWGSAIPSRTNYSSDWKPWAPIALAPCLGLPAVWPECTLGAGDSFGEVTEQWGRDGCLLVLGSWLLQSLGAPGSSVRHKGPGPVLFWSSTCGIFLYYLGHGIWGGGNDLQHHFSLLGFNQFARKPAFDCTGPLSAKFVWIRRWTRESSWSRCTPGPWLSWVLLTASRRSHRAINSFLNPSPPQKKRL